MSEKRVFSSVLAATITQYVTLKQALGRRYAVERAVLQHLDRFLATAGTDLNPETFASWCGQLVHLASGVRRNWMRIVRNLCLYRRRTDSICFVPDPLQFPPQHQPVRPYIFTEQEIAKLLRTAEELHPTWSAPLRPQAYRLAIVLLYTMGLRRGELLRMTFGDYDASENTLLVRESKFHKSRLLPLSTDGQREFALYLEAHRAGQLPMSHEQPVIWNRREGGHGYSGASFGRGVRDLLRDAGIHTLTGKLPRTHDIRHTFAVHALLRWYRSGVDVQTKLPFLAAYMGHVSIVSTQHYLHFTDELAAAASERFAQRYGPLVNAPWAPQGGGR